MINLLFIQYLEQFSHSQRQQLQKNNHTKDQPAFLGSLDNPAIINNKIIIIQVM